MKLVFKKELLCNGVVYVFFVLMCYYVVCLESCLLDGLEFIDLCQ